MDLWTPLLEALELLSAQRLIRGRLDELIEVLGRVADVRRALGGAR